jgi:hypothetical protein
MRLRLSIALGLALAIGLGAGAWSLHEKHDRLRQREVIRADAGPLFERLARGSFGVIEELRRDIEEVGGEWAPLAELLPDPKEPWVEVTEGIITRREVPALAEGSELIIEPRGRVLPGRLRLRLGKLPRPAASLRLRELDSGVERRAPWPGGDSALIPESCQLAAGQRHQIELLDAAGEVLATTRCETVSEPALREIQRDAALLTRLIADPQLRRYAQGILAMTRGLHDRAAQLLIDGFANALTEVHRPDLAWRRVFLFHRRGEPVPRDRVAARLRGI